MRAVTVLPATRRRASISSPTVADKPGMFRVRRGPIASRSLPAWTRKPTAERGLANQCRTSRRPAARPPARERLAEDAGEEAGGRLVGLARPDADRRQANADAIEKALPGIVGKQQLADRLLRAVAGQRRREELVADGLGERRAEHRDRRGEHHPRLVADAFLADRLEEERVPSRLMR